MRKRGTLCLQRYTVQEALQHFLGYSESDAADTAFLHGIMAANRIVNTMPSESVHWLQYLIFDHLVMLLTNTENIRDAILYPMVAGPNA